MPYLPSEAAKKSELYSNILNGAELEYQRAVEFLKQQQQISGSVDANAPLRDDDGFLVSFESEEAGIALEEQFEEVRLENSQYFFEGEMDTEFTYYFQPESEDDEDDSDDAEGTTDEEVEFQMTKRDNLIQVMNEYFSESNTPSAREKPACGQISRTAQTWSFHLKTAIGSSVESGSLPIKPSP